MPHEQIAQWYWEQLNPKVNTDPEPCKKPKVQQIADVLKDRYPDQSNTDLANEYSKILDISLENLRQKMSNTDQPTEDAKKWVDWKLGQN
jgi:glucan phosphorylase